MNKNYFFTDAKGDPYQKWETKTLGEIAEIVAGGTPSTGEPNYWDGEINWFSPTEVGKTKYLNESSRRITEEGLKNSSAKVLPVGTVLLTTRASLGRMGILRSEAATNQGFQSLLPKNNTISEFLYYLQSQIESYCDVKASGSTFREISGKEIAKMPLLLPSLAEQQKIAEFFSALDERIALTADKVKLLKEQKQGYLQKIFSRELVFTGDTYRDWEQKKLGEVAKLVTGTTPDTTNPEYWGGDYPWVTPADMGRKKNLDSSGRTVTKSGLQKSRGLPAGSLLVTCIGATIGKMAILSVEGSCNQQNNAVLPSDSISVGYLYYFLATQVDKMKSLAGNTATPILNKTEFGKLDVMLPSLPEQEKIAEFFSALDELIELTENKLALLKEQKKGYLQGIFG